MQQIMLAKGPSMRSVDQLFAHLHNVNPIADRISPACDIGQVNKSAGTPG